MKKRPWPMLTARVCVAAGLLWTLAGGSANALQNDDRREPLSTSRRSVTQPQQAPKNNGQANSAPIKITAIGNKLVISSDDPRALATAQELIRLLTQPQSGQGDYETIRLKNASATEAAKALDEAFNGPRQQSTQPEQGGAGAGFGGAVAVRGNSSARSRPPG